MPLKENVWVAEGGFVTDGMVWYGIVEFSVPLDTV